MRKMLAVLAAAGLLVAGVATTVSAQQYPTQGAQPDGYPLSWRRNFVQGCMSGPNGLPKAVCECGIRNIEMEVPFADSDALDRAASAGQQPAQRTLDQYRSVMQRCVANSDF
ncbi:MAG: hypothetical protein AB7Q23_16945 [Hyphomonadaceae bacterium]